MADHKCQEKGNHLTLWDEVKIVDWEELCLKEEAHMLNRPSIDEYDL